MENQLEVWVFLALLVMVLSVALASSRSPRRERKASYRASKPKQTTGHRKAKVLKVIDGDTVIVVSRRQKIKVRLDAIDCPENDQPWGDTAKYGLIKLIGGREIWLEEHGVDPHGRTLATLYVEDRETNTHLNVNERMVTLGHAWVARIYCDHLSSARKVQLNRLERWARSKNVGLWKTSRPIPPWRWRRGNR